MKKGNVFGSISGVFTLLIFVCPSAVLAHPGHGAASSETLQHWFGPDHLLATIAIGLLIFRLVKTGASRVKQVAQSESRMRRSSNAEARTTSRS